MLVNYLKIFFRTLHKQKLYTLINLSGLVIGIACTIFIVMWLLNELGYDRFYANAGDIYRVEQRLHNPDGIISVAVTPTPLAPILKENLPEVREAARVHYMNDMLFVNEGKRFIEERILAVDPGFLQIFSFTLLDGNTETALQNTNAIVITRKIAEKYFATTRAAGKVLVVNDVLSVSIDAVIEDLPANTHLDFEILVPLAFALNMGREIFPEEWHRFDEIDTYVLLQKNYPFRKMNAQIAQLKQHYTTEWEDEFYLQPVSKIHISPEVEYNMAPVIDIKYIYIFSIIAGFILLIACINFINLSTARTIQRNREIGMRKVLGASRKRLLVQLLGESVLFTIIAFIIAAVVVVILEPVLQKLVGDYSLFNIWQHGNTGIIFSVIALITGLLAGCYPAFYLSAYSPLQTINMQNEQGGRSGALRKVLVVVQFSISVFLIIGTLVVSAQFHFMKNNEPGFIKENVLSIPMNMPPGVGLFSEKFGSFKNELLQSPNIVGVSMACGSPADLGTSAGEASWEGKPDDYTLLVHWNAVFYDYFETLGIPCVAGRTFSEQYPNDIDPEGNHPAFILNEAAIEAMNVENPLSLNFELYSKTGPIVGVVKDFHYRSLKNKIEPMAFFITPYFNRIVLVRIRTGDVSQSLAFIRQVWDKFADGYSFEYEFLDQQYNELYKSEQRLALLIRYLSGIAVFIACMGLFGLSVYSAERRTKEIGIRKVLGASITGLVIMLFKEFVKWVLLANLIAWPVAWCIMHRWLQDFAYRIDLQYWMFFLAGALALAFALLTICWHVIRAARANPVEALKYE